MKIVFRMNYRTFSGQSLWVKWAVKNGGGDELFLLPLRWINEGQWQGEVDLPCDGPLCVTYAYQLRQDFNGVELDEWGDPRCVDIDPAESEVLLLKDDWRSAGALDCIFETDALREILPPRAKPATSGSSSSGNHTFRLMMTAVPENLVPCVIGSIGELGDWDLHRAVPMSPVEPDVWQASIDVPADWWIEYKYGLYDTERRCAVRLETGANRLLESHAFAASQKTILSDANFRRDPAELPRAAGVAIPVFSLRSEKGLGVGEFADLIPLGDWAAQVGLRLIQILPINDTTSAHDWTDSYPYSAISAFALHPIYLRIEDLDMGYAMPEEFPVQLDSAREWLNALENLDHVEVMKVKTELTRRVFARHHKKITASDGFRNFLKENHDWLVPYAAFCVKRDEHGTADFSRWGEWAVFDQEKADAMATSDHPQWREVSYHIWLQYELDRQLSAAVGHLRKLGIALKGDLPIGIDRQSADAWSAPHLFKMDSQAGAPPDAFADKGQNWGFPTYNWEAMQRDGYAWWQFRFERLARYFDAFRIDHILGFFRIWQIPQDQVEGIMGWFDPALPFSADEIRSRGITFEINRYCRPYIHLDSLDARFGQNVDEAVREYLRDCGGGFYQLREHVANQRLIEKHFNGAPASAGNERLRSALLDCASDVLFFEVPGSNGTLFHPRYSMHTTQSFLALDHDVKCRLDDLYIDYFYRRHEAFWQARGYEKLPVMRHASSMLLCGEDLGMVPDCVPGVMRELGMLSLEIQRMPKFPGVEFADPAHAPYLSVASPSTHDMATLRGWWREDPQATARFAGQMLGEYFPPLELGGDLAERIIRQHLESPAMWAVLPLQDLLAMDESLRHPDPDAERINVPAITPYYWRYRMHLALDELVAADEFNASVSRLLKAAGRVVMGTGTAQRSP